MYIKDKTIYFNSYPENYIKEEGGLKNGTTRELEGDELKEFLSTPIKKIVIRNTETGESFEREVSCCDPILSEIRPRKNKTLRRVEFWAIYWYPVRKRRAGKSEEEAVAEKRGML